MNLAGVEVSARRARERAERYVGQTFGRLTILAVYQRAPPDARRRRVADVRCACGERRGGMLLDNILRGAARSCGCWDAWAARYGAIGTHERRLARIRNVARQRRHNWRFLRRELYPGPTTEEFEYIADLVCTTRERPRPWDGELAPWGDDVAADVPPEGGS